MEILPGSCVVRNENSDKEILMLQKDLEHFAGICDGSLSSCQILNLRHVLFHILKTKAVGYASESMLRVQCHHFPVNGISRTEESLTFGRCSCGVFPGTR